MIIKTLFGVVFAFVTGLGIISAFAVEVCLDWNAPVKNEDGTGLQDLEKYLLYHGLERHGFDTETDVGNVTSYCRDYAEGVHWFRLKAVDTSGNRSVYSRWQKVLVRADAYVKVRRVRETVRGLRVGP